LKSVSEAKLVGYGDHRNSLAKQIRPHPSNMHLLQYAPHARARNDLQQHLAYAAEKFGNALNFKRLGVSNAIKNCATTLRMRGR
jgi:hypothetical protein